jgi:hypothetical protein
MAETHPLGRAFQLDEAAAHPHIYDGVFGQFHVELEETTFSWKPLAPAQRRFMLPCVLRIEDVGPALVALARGQGRAFRMAETDLLEWTRRVRTVYMPEGDHRLALLAKPGDACELPGLRMGTGLLIDGENVGRLCRMGPRWGLVVWGAVCAVEISAGFDADPRIRIPRT